MRLLKFVVEGERDLYFLHNLFVNRFSNLLTPVFPAGETDLAYGKKDLFAYKIIAKHDAEVKVVQAGGYRKIKTLKTEMQNSDPAYDLERVCAIYDADTTGVDNGGVVARTTFLNAEIAKFGLGTQGPQRGHSIFLSPDNSADGDLEILLHAMALPRNVSFFDPSWMEFDASLSTNGYSSLSRKTMIYDYIEACACKCPKPVSIKDDKGYDKNLAQGALWDWFTPRLDDLVSYITTEISSM